MTVFADNRALLDAFRQGKPEALRLVYLFYVDHVVALLHSGFTEKKSGTYIRGVRDPEQRRELLQEVFIRAFSAKARTAYDGLRPYRSFLSTIAGNIIIDAWRSDTRNPLSTALRQCEEGSFQSVLEMEVDEETNCANEEEQVHFRRCLEESDKFVESLNIQSQEFVRLRFQEELPQEEAAKKLRLSRSKVRTLEKRIRANLRKHLKKCGLLEN